MGAAAADNLGAADVGNVVEETLASLILELQYIMCGMQHASFLQEMADGLLRGTQKQLYAALGDTALKQAQKERMRTTMIEPSQPML